MKRLACIGVALVVIAGCSSETPSVNPDVTPDTTLVMDVKPGMT